MEMDCEGIVKRAFCNDPLDWNAGFTKKLVRPDVAIVVVLALNLYLSAVSRVNIYLNDFIECG